MYVINFALKMEKVGKEYFRKLARETSLAGVKKVFDMLADEQQELYNRFKSMKSRVGAPFMVNSEILDRAKNIFGRIFDENLSHVKLLKNDLEAYRHALGIEAEIVSFFEEMAVKETNEDAKTLLMEIAAEEKKRYFEIEDICDFVAAPKSYLAWMEFSNLKEM